MNQALNAAHIHHMFMLALGIAGCAIISKYATGGSSIAEKALKSLAGRLIRHFRLKSNLEDALLIAQEDSMEKDMLIADLQKTISELCVENTKLKAELKQAKQKPIPQDNANDNITRSKSQLPKLSWFKLH